ncbi:response regulator transcription factor, partial [Pseudoalteromonas sp. GAB2316C]|uniref:response regulator transcription factor n=1 Tax=Pseudoalteromonas sp. GAB2316C TaxID=3025326 RepID=UPI002359BADE
MLNVLLVEDDQDLALTIVQYLDIHGVRCDNASNGVSGLQLIRNNHYDVILLDLNLPRMDGLSVCREVRREGNDTSILMLTARDELSDKVDGFESGTDDYLVKPFELQEMLVRVRSLAKRKSGQVQRL